MAAAAATALLGAPDIGGAASGGAGEERLRIIRFPEVGL